jgi:hypothetical protein
MTVSISLALVEAALVAMRQAALGAAAPAGGWVLGLQDPGTVRWPYVDLDVQWNQARGTAEATVVETVHANTRDEAVAIAARLATALTERSYAGTGVRIIGHELLTGPRVHRRMESTTAELTWRASIGWKP